MFKYDTHVHTWEVSPCGKIKAAEGIKLYKKRGYSGLVITDHYSETVFESLDGDSWEEKIEQYLSGYRAALREGRKEGMDILLGAEITFIDSLNDYLVFGIDEEFLKEYPELYKINLRKFRELVKGKDILVFQAHPFRPGMKAADPLLLDGVEVYNGNPRHDSRNHLAYSFAQENRLKVISGSDFHQLQDLARGGIILPERVSSSREFVKLLKESDSIELIGDALLEMIL